MARMTGPLPVRGSVAIPEAELHWRFSRSAGPGGQHVNTTDTRVELSFDVARSRALPEVWRARAVERLAGRLVDGTVSVTAQEFRSQARNREAARSRLAGLLADATAPPSRARRATRPTRGAQRRRMDAKRRRGATKRLRGRPESE